MQISSNYQILPNKYSALNYGYLQRNNRSQYSIQNVSADRNSINTCQGKINQITFAALPKEILLEKAEGILSRSIVFGPEEYKNLSNADAEILREYSKYFIEKDSRVINFILDFGRLFSKRIHEKYPNGFIFVPLGRSPAFLGKYLEFQGEDVKYCPISGLQRYKKFSTDFIKTYKKYLDTIGLTKEFAENTQKQIIITDHTNSGNTLAQFEDLLASPEIGIKEGEKVIFIPIIYSGFGRSGKGIFNCHWMYLRYKDDDCNIGEDYGDVVAIQQSHKKYTSIPWLYTDLKNLTEETLSKFYDNKNRFKENFDTKMMNFIIADSIYNK